MLYDHAQEAAAFITKASGRGAEIGIVLGTGMGNLREDIDVEAVIPYRDIPHFPVSTVKSHAGELLIGQIGDRKVVAMAGRFHYYEGYTMQQVTFPIRVMKALGVKRLFLSNAAGSVNERMHVGDLVFLTDHINLMPDNPLRGPNDERFGPRFPDLLHTYDKKMVARALRMAHDLGYRAHEGVYAALPGPNLETPAEYHYLHTIGADLVGMSTVPEVLVARHMEIPVFVASIVSNQCYPIDQLGETTLEDVIRAVEHAEPRLRVVIHNLITEG